jgi:AraC family transcriptional regulator
MNFPAQTRVSTVQDFRNEHFRIIDSLYSPGLKQPRHAHLFASFSFASSGNYLERFGKSTFAREPSTVIFHPPHESHAVEFQNRVRILSVQFSFEKLEQIRRQSLVLNSPSSCRTETAVRLGNCIYRELKRMDEFSILAIEGLALEILAEASRSKISVNEKNIPHWLKEAKDFLHDNFAESVALEDVAEIADVHPAHLSRVFRAKFGCTIGEYVRRLRLDFVCRQLSETDTPLSEVAVAAGFSDQSHLNKTFKNFCGLTPSEYRKTCRKMLI